MTEVRFPNESKDYRDAREALLLAEVELRGQVERVAEQRRQLPSGGELRENYVFKEQQGGDVVDTSFSDLFADGHDTLFLYNFMFAQPATSPCTMCTVFLDGLDGQVPHIEQRISTAVVAKTDCATLNIFGRERGWKNLRLLSSGSTTFNADYLGETESGQIPMAHVFTRSNGKICHRWSSEMEFAEPVVGGNGRHLDMMWPLWNVLDTTPQGRGNWYPSLDYSDK